MIDEEKQIDNTADRQRHLRVKRAMTSEAASSNNLNGKRKHRGRHSVAAQVNPPSDTATMDEHRQRRPPQAEYQKSFV